MLHLLRQQTCSFDIIIVDNPRSHSPPSPSSFGRKRQRNKKDVELHGLLPLDARFDRWQSVENAPGQPAKLCTPPSGAVRPTTIEPRSTKMEAQRISLRSLRMPVRRGSLDFMSSSPQSLSPGRSKTLTILSSALDNMSLSDGDHSCRP